jgi:hypothetical protein
MDNPSPASPQPNQSGSPAPVVLQPKANDQGDQASASKKDEPIHLAKRSFKPSHTATFVAIGVIGLILAITVGGIAFVIQKQSQTKSKTGLSDISVNKSLLDQLGVNRSSATDPSVALVVTPNAQFNGTLTVGKDVKIATKLSAGQTSLTQLDAGNTSLTQLNVNGASSLSDTAVRTNLTVAGTSKLQGPVQIDKILTAGAINIVGDLTVGGVLTTSTFSARSLTSTSTLTIGGHVVTNGPVPGISQGSAPGPSGTVSVSGNDSSGTIAMNTGQAPVAGIIATITFRTPYGSIPHVVVSPVGAPTGSLQYYINRTATGFSIGTNNAPEPGSGYVFDYIVQQ